MPSVDFQKTVLEESRRRPVVVDFWAPWCGPCQSLSTLLEDLSKTSDGHWSLVSLNIDEHPDIVEQYTVRGIPDVRIFHRASSIAGFTGALSKEKVMTWLENNLPDDNLQHLQELQRTYTNQPQAFSTALEGFIDQHQDFKTAKVLLAMEKVWSSPQQAVELIGTIQEGHKEFEKAEAVRELSRLMLLEEDGQPSVYQVLMEAKSAFADNNIKSGAQKLIEAISIDKNYNQALPKKAALALFQILGKQHPVSLKYRPLFDMAIY